MTNIIDNDKHDDDKGSLTETWEVEKAIQHIKKRKTMRSDQIANSEEMRLTNLINSAKIFGQKISLRPLKSSTKRINTMLGNVKLQDDCFMS